MLVREMMKGPVRVQAEETLDAAARKLKNETAISRCGASQVNGTLAR